MQRENHIISSNVTTEQAPGQYLNARKKKHQNNIRKIQFQLT